MSYSLAVRGKRYRINSKVLFAVVLVLSVFLTLFFIQNLKSSQVEAANFPGEQRFIVKLAGAIPATSDSSRALNEQKANIETKAQSVEDKISHLSGNLQVVLTYENLPYVVVRADAAGYQSLVKTYGDSNVREEQLLSVPKTLDAVSPVKVVGSTTSDGVFSDGTGSYDGTGYSVAIIDTGVDKNHSLLSGKVVQEYCFGEASFVYSNMEFVNICPGGATFSDTVGSALDCTIAGCGHGTKVAGAVAMTANSLDLSATIPGAETIYNAGVAPGADIIAMKVVEQINEVSGGPDVCGDGSGTLSTCAVPLESLYLAAVDKLATISATHPIAAANMSIGSTVDFAATNEQCTAFGSGVNTFNDAAALLKSKGIAMVVASGNSGDNPLYVDKISEPSCVPQAVAVSATRASGTEIASYANNGPLVDLLAPGGDQVETSPGSGEYLYDEVLWLPLNESTTGELEASQGTSFAAPMAAGAYAVLREKHPNASVDSLTSLLQSSGTSVTDNRPGYTVGAKKLINVANALANSPYPSVATFTGPSGTLNEGDTMTVNFTVANAVSCSIDNGVGNVWSTGDSSSASKVVPVKASYKLTCTNAYGDTADKTLSSTVNTGPTTPGSLTGDLDTSARTYTLTWTPSSDPDGVANYLVYVNGSLVATLDSDVLQFTLENIADGTEYNIEIMALDSLGAKSVAATKSFSTGGAAGGLGAGGGTGTPNTGFSNISSSGAWILGGAVVSLMIAGGLSTLLRRRAE